MRSCIERALKLHSLEETEGFSWSLMGTLLTVNYQQIARFYAENAGFQKCPRQESNLRPKD
jgi:hypothetical protein